MSYTLHSFIDTMIPAVEAEMQQVLLTDQETTALYGMMHYHMGWADERLQPVQAPSGKRIRPLLCLLTCEAAGGQWQQALPAAAAIELLHNFTLIHDDIQDASPTRRGRPTVWKIWGIPQAINSGDGMFALSHDSLYRLVDLKVPSSIVVQAARRFDQTCVDLTEGQYRDMDFEVRQQVSAKEYLEMIGGKTAALLSLCGELGALIARADEPTVEHYAAFARDLGMAFQVKDDILGIWGDEEAIGKSAATDIETRKKTLPVLYGLQQSQALTELYAQPTNGAQFVEQVVKLLDDCGAHSYAHEQAGFYSESALDHLQAAAPQGEAGEALYQLAARLLERQA